MNALWLGPDTTYRPELERQLEALGHPVVELVAHESALAGEDLHAKQIGFIIVAEAPDESIWQLPAALALDGMPPPAIIQIVSQLPTAVTLSSDRGLARLVLPTTAPTLRATLELAWARRESARAIESPHAPAPMFTDPGGLLASVNANLQDTIVFRFLHRADGSLECAYVSPNIEHMVGIDQAAFMADPTASFRLFAPLDLEKLLTIARTDSRARTGATVSADVRIELQDGGHRWIEFRSRHVETLADGTHVRDGIGLDVTAAHGDKIERRKLHDQLEMTLRTGGACAWEANIEQNRFTLSPGWMEIRGYPAATSCLNTRGLLRVTHPEDRHRMLQALKPILAGEEQPLEFEHRVATADGGWRWMQCRGRRTESTSEGKVSRLIGVSFDITDKKQAEEKIARLNADLRERVAQSTEELALTKQSLRQSQTRLRAMFENCPVMIAMLKMPEGRILEMNPAGCAIFGYEREELIGHTTLERGLWPQPEDRAEFVDELLQQGEVKAHEVTLVRRDGSRFPAMFYTTLLKIDGELYSMNCMQDVETQQESETQLRNMISQSPLGFYRTTADGEVLVSNPALRRMLGIDASEASSRQSLWDGIRFVDLPREELSAKLTERNELRGVESSWERADGALLRVRETIRVVRDPNGEIRYYEGAVEDITARHEAEEALRKSEERWKLAVEGLGDGAWDWNIVTGSVVFSRRWKEMLGYEEGEVADNYQAWEQLVHPDDLPSALKTLKVAIAGDPRPFRFENRMKTKDGGWKWILSRGIAVDRDETGKSRRMVGSHSDITERKAIEREISALNTQLEARVKQRTAALEKEIETRREAERKVAASEAQYRHVVERAQEVIIDIGVDRTIQFLNPAWQVVMGYSMPESLGQDFLRYVHPDEQDEWERQYAQLMKGNLTEDPALLRLVTKAGSPRWMEFRVQVSRSADGEISGSTGFLLNRTEQHQAEQELRDSEQRYQHAVSATNDGLWDWNLVDDSVYFSPRWEEMMGFEIGALEPSMATFYRVVHPDDQEDVLSDVRRYLANKTPAYVREHRMIDADGQVRWTLNRARAIYDDYGKPIRLVGTTTDITKQRKAELQLRQRSYELEAVNEELEAFSYSVSHDLRAPLRGVDGWSLALSEDFGNALGESGNEIIKRLRGEAQRMDKLIDGLLELARTNRNSMRRQKVHLHRLAAKIVGNLRRDHPDRNVHWDVAPDLEVEGDPLLLESLLTNLLNNAWKFTQNEPHPTVAFGCESTPRGPAFFVRDNGVGFDLAYADKLFTPFQRMHKPSEFAGAGIGLAIVHRIIRRHGGEVWAEAVIGGGATFYFTLPDL
jgi:PAS domain S-box-containing protein